MTRLTIALLGPLEIRLDDQPVTPLIMGKACALLAYLAVEADRAHRRETLAGLLWPDNDERSARANLRNTLSNLRKGIGDRARSDDRAPSGDGAQPHLLVTRETIQFNNASDCWVDVAAFCEWLQASGSTEQRLENAVALYRGPFLDSFSRGDSSAFDDWASGVRERMAHQFSVVLQRLVTAYEQRGELERACEVARQQVAHAPWQEQAYQNLMRLLALNGQRGVALAQYEACRRALREVLNVEPGEETRRLYERIRDGELASPAPPLSPPTGGKDADIVSISPKTEAHPIAPSAQPTVPAPPPLVFPQLGESEGGLEGERRVITAMFADVKGSTALAGQIDTEDWVEIMRHALQILSAEIHRYGGEIDRYEGDGLVAFFGLSTTHEDDAERAVLAALAMQEATKRHAAELAEEQGIELLLRVGLSSGEVITTYVGEARQHGETTAMGRTVALAARLEPAAEPGTVLVSENTYRLVERAFEWQAMGGIAAKGYSEPVVAYRPLKHRATAGKVRGIVGLESPLVGRDGELMALDKALDGLKRGVGGVVTVTGEAGIGKSRLVAELRKKITGEHLQWAEGRCLSYGGSIAYQLWLDMVRGLLGIAPDAPPDVVRTALEEWVQASCPDCYEAVYPYMARLLSLSLDERTASALRGLGAEGLKAHTFRAWETLVERAAMRRPLLLACEDLHWADPTSLELLEQLLPLSDRVPLLILGVFRPERRHGCWRIIETAARDYPHCHTDLRLVPLSAAESEVLVGNLLSLSYARDAALRVEDLPEQLRSGVLGRAEGNPFFVEEILRALIDNGIIAHDDPGGRWYAIRDVPDIPIPDTLHGVLNARIDRLEPETRWVLQLAAVIGRIFSYPVLAAIASPSTTIGGAVRGEERDWESDGLLAHLVTLERAQLVRERARLPEREYSFKHQLTQEAAYNGLLKRERRIYHRQVAEALERLYPQRIEERVELLAHHWEQAGEAEKAIVYLQQAGEKAVQLSAYPEGRAHLTRALALLEALPEAVGPEQRLQRAECELALQHSLGIACWSTFSTYPEAARAYDRARELCEQMGKTSQLCTILGQLALLRYVGSEYQDAHALGQETLNVAQQTGDPILVAASHWRLGVILFALGEYTAARAHLEQTIAFYEPHHHQALVSLSVADAGPSAVAYDALCLWCLGYPDQALRRSEEALALARELDHPFTLGDVLSYAGCQLHAMRRDAQALRESAEELMRIPSGMDLSWRIKGILHRGEAAAMMGQVQEGMAQMREGIAAFHAVGAGTLLPGALGSLALAQAEAGQPQEGLATLAEALTLVAETDEHHSEAELNRLRGELLLMQDDEAEAEASLREAESCFQHAIEVARRQQAKSWELRATTSLAGLWREQGRVDEARQVLGEIYGWFTEGFDTADLRDARSLLEELS